MDMLYHELLIGFSVAQSIKQASYSACVLLLQEHDLAVFV